MRWLAWLVVVVGGCTGCPPGIVVPPAPIPLGSVDGAVDDCSTACDHAATCGCSWAVGDVELCVLACRRDQAAGSAAQLDAACPAAAKDCSTLKACKGVTGCK